MKIKLNSEQLQILNSSTDFNIICILQTSLESDNILSLSDDHVEMLYDFCCNSDNKEMMWLANTILKNDRSIIKPISLS